MKVLRHFVSWAAGRDAPITTLRAVESDRVLAHAAGRHHVAEVGVFEGVTAARLRRVMAPDGVLYAVDPYPAGRLGFNMHRVIARREVGRVANGRVRWVRAEGARAAARLDAEGVRLDFVFLDALKDYDGFGGLWEAWSPLVVAGGLLAVNDSRPTATRAIDSVGSVRYTAAVILRDARFEVADTVESLTILRRRPVV